MSYSKQSMAINFLIISQPSLVQARGLWDAKIMFHFSQVFIRFSGILPKWLLSDHLKLHSPATKFCVSQLARVTAVSLGQAGPGPRESAVSHTPSGAILWSDGYWHPCLFWVIPNPWDTRTLPSLILEKGHPELWGKLIVPRKKNIQKGENTRNKSTLNQWT